MRSLPMCAPVWLLRLKGYLMPIPRNRLQHLPPLRPLPVKDLPLALMPRSTICSIDVRSRVFWRFAVLSGLTI